MEHVRLTCVCGAWLDIIAESKVVEAKTRSFWEQHKGEGHGRREDKDESKP